MRTAIEGGLADAWGEFDILKEEKVDTGQVGSAPFLGLSLPVRERPSFRSRMRSGR
jgi:hypothetical protein